MRVLIAVLTLALTATAMQNSEDETVRAELRAGMELFEKGRFEDAIPYFARVRRIAPAHWQGHAWQALSLIQLAYVESDMQRRRDLLSEAEAMTGPLVREAGLMFSDPLRHYILGLVQHGRRHDPESLQHFKKARNADAGQFAPYREIRLRDQVERAYGRSLTMIATRILLEGNFDRAEALFEEAQRCLQKQAGTEQNLADILHNLAIINEQLGRKEKAIRHLRKLIEFYKDDREKRESFLASIANIHTKNEEIEKALSVMAEIPAESRNPKVMEARCRVRKLKALREPETGVMDETLAYYRDVLKTHPEGERFRLVEDFAELVLEKVLPPDVAGNRELIGEAVAMLEVELRRRPECPSFYFLLYKCHKLLGDKEKAAEYESLHRIKKKEYDSKSRYDSQGRPRCTMGS